ncbi:hypothetical protein FOZ61_005520 [Perkinsus olseni]|uniref:Uncharacterized protein n=1 Tax=Perkinsus olseni TaxID=32597 RepID=A0A7J6LH02_PEROL|nr:hypothetical protein FOZ61_005520 [Perkinsus olseni]
MCRANVFGLIKWEIGTTQASFSNQNALFALVSAKQFRAEGFTVKPLPVIRQSSRVELPMRKLKKQKAKGRFQPSAKKVTDAMAPGSELVPYIPREYVRVTTRFFSNPEQIEALMNFIFSPLKPEDTESDRKEYEEELGRFQDMQRKYTEGFRKHEEEAERLAHAAIAQLPADLYDEAIKSEPEALPRELKLHVMYYNQFRQDLTELEQVKLQLFHNLMYIRYPHYEHKRRSPEKFWVPENRIMSRQQEAALKQKEAAHRLSGRSSFGSTRDNSLKGPSIEGYSPEDTRRADKSAGFPKNNRPSSALYDFESHLRSLLPPKFYRTFGADSFLSAAHKSGRTRRVRIKSKSREEKRELINLWREEKLRQAQKKDLEALEERKAEERLRRRQEAARRRRAEILKERLYEYELDREMIKESREQKEEADRIRAKLAAQRDARRRQLIKQKIAEWRESGLIEDPPVASATSDSRGDGLPFGLRPNTKYGIRNYAATHPAPVKLPPMAGLDRGVRASLSARPSEKIPERTTMTEWIINNLRPNTVKI